MVIFQYDESEMWKNLDKVAAEQLMNDLRLGRCTVLVELTVGCSDKVDYIGSGKLNFEVQGLVTVVRLFGFKTRFFKTVVPI